MRQVSLAITHFNRLPLLKECIAKVHNDPRVGEIVISDDCSTDGSFRKMWREFASDSKIKLFQNKENLDCYFNKQKAVERATSEWVILFDSDNVLPLSYLDAIFAIEKWDPKIVYCPEYAEPHFDYRSFASKIIDRRNVAQFMIKPRFNNFLNTANYFVNRAAYLEVWDPTVNPYTADSIYQLYNWLVKGKRILCLQGMRYFHRVHKDSHYKLNSHKTGKLPKLLEDKLRALR